MDCTIDFKNEETKKVFMQRADNVGARAALISLLNEADSSRYLSIEKELRENNLYSEVMKRIFANSPLGVTDTLRAMDVETEMGQEIPEVITQTLDEIRIELEDKMQIDAEFYSETGNNASAQAAVSRYIMLENFRALSKTVSDKITRLQRQMSGDNVIYENEENQAIDANDRSSNDLIHSQDRLEQSTEKFVAAEIIALLSTLPKFTFNSNGELVQSYDELGFRELGDMQGARGYLTSAMTGKISFEKMMETLAEDSKTIPQAAGIYQLLTDAFKSKGATVTVNLGKETRVYNNTENAFYKSFRTVLRGLTTVNIREKEVVSKDPENPDKVTRSKKTIASVFNAGEQTRAADIQRKFYYALDELQSKSLEARKSFWRDLQSKYPVLFTNTNLDSKGKPTTAEVDGKTVLKVDSRQLALSVKNEGDYHDKGVNILRELSLFLDDLGVEANVATLKEFKNQVIAIQRSLKNKSKKTAQEQEQSTVLLSKALFDAFFGGQRSLMGEVQTILTEELTSTSNSPSTRGVQRFRELARARAAKGEDKIVPGSVTTGDGKSRHTSNLVDNMSDVFESLANPESDMFKEFVADPILRNTYLMEIFSRYDVHAPSLEDTSTYDNKKLNISKSYKDMTTQEEFIYEWTSFRNTTYAGHDRTKTSHRILAPTMQDRKNTKVVELPLVNGRDDVSGGAIDATAWRNFKPSYAMIKSINTEVARINQVRKEMREFTGEKANLLIAGYSKPNFKGETFGDKFCFWPELQNSDIFIDNAEGYLVLNTEKYGTEGPKFKLLDTSLASIENDFVEAEIAYYTEKGVISDKTKKGGDYITLTDTMGELMEKEASSTGMVAQITRKQFKDMLLLKRAIGNDVTMLTMGDIAYLGASASTIADLMLPANKRFGMTGTPGQKGRNGDGGAAPKYGVAVMSDYKDHSDYVAEFDELNGGTKWEDNKTNVTDGVGLCTLERLADILGSMGELTPAVAAALEELNKDNASDINWERVNGVLDIQKGFYLAQRYDSSYGRVMPKNSKYSLVPIIPALVKNNEAMQSLLKRMKEGGTTAEGVNIPVGEAVFESTFKLGANRINDAYGTEPLQVMEFHSEHWLRPQITTHKTSDEANLGAQIRAMIVGNLPVSAIFGGKTSTQHVQEYDAAISTIIDSSVEESQESITDENDVIDKRKLGSETVKHLEKTSVDGVVPRYTKALKKVRNGTITATRLKQVASSIQKMLSKKTRDNIKIKLKGVQAIQVTAFGHTTFSKDQGSTSKKLKMAHIGKDGKVVAAEIIVTPHYFLTELRKRKQKLQARGKKSERVLAKLENVEQTQEVVEEKMRLVDELADIREGLASMEKVVLEMKQGTFNVETIPESLREVIAYRVPTQEKSSFLPCKIVGFSAHSQGQQIIVPPEFTTSSGSDYDIDKLFLIFDEMDVSSNGDFVTNIGKDKVRNAKRTVKRTMMDTLMHPSVFGSVVDVNSVETIEQYDNMLAELSPERFGENVNRNRVWGSMSTQNDLRLANQASSRGISDSMVYLKNIQVYNRLGLHLGVRSNRSKGVFKKINEIIAQRDAEIASSSSIIKNKVEYRNGKKVITVTTYNDGSVTKKEGRKLSKFENAQEEGLRIPDIENYTSHRIRVDNIEAAKPIMDKYDKLVEDVDINSDEFANYSEKSEVELFPSAGIMIYPNTMVGQKEAMFGDNPGISVDEATVFEPGKMYDFVTTSDLTDADSKTEVKVAILNAIAAGAQVRVTGETATEFVEESTHLDKIEVEGGTILTLKEKVDPAIETLKTEVIHGKVNDKINFSEFTVDGKVPKMSNLTEQEVAAVSRAFVAWSSAALDSPEMTGKYNINEVTKDAFGYLLAIGGDMEYALLMLNHPAVVAFVDEVSKFSTDKPFDAIRLAKKKMGADKAYYDIKKEDLKESYSNEKDVHVLSNFLALSDIGNNLYKMFISSNSDTKGVHSNASQAVLKGESLSKIRGTNSFEILGDVTESNNAFTFDNEMYNNHHVSSYEKIVTNHLTNIGSVSIEGTPGFKNTVGRVEKILGKMLSAKQRTMLEADVYTYLMTANNTVLDISAEKATSLFVGNNTVLKQLQKIQEMDRLKNVESNGNYSRNGVIQRLTPRKEMVVLGNSAIEMEFVDFDSRAWNNNPQSLQNDVINDFTALLEDSNEEVRSFAIDAIRADMLRSGSSYSVSSIAPVIPDEFFTNSYTQTNSKGVTKNFKSIADSLLNSEHRIMSPDHTLGGEEIVKQFLANRYDQLGIRDLTHSSEETIHNVSQVSKVAILDGQITELEKGKFGKPLVPINNINRTFIPVNDRHTMSIEQANTVQGVDQTHCLF